MTRIIAGAARGRRLAVPAAGVRPTSDRAREGLFNSLATMVELDGSRFLDLYAGSGAVGLEAASRGASVTLVESDRAAQAVIASNLTAIGPATTATAVVARVSVESFLAGTPSGSFDVVFADPPYAAPDEEVHAVLQSLVDGSWLAERAVVIVERSARSPEPVWPSQLDSAKQKRYGEGVLWYGRRR